MKIKDKFTFISFLIIFLAYNIVGYIFDIEILQFIKFHKNGFGISFVAIIVPIIISYLIYYIIKYLNIDIKYNE